MPLHCATRPLPIPRTRTLFRFGAVALLVVVLQGCRSGPVVRDVSLPGQAKVLLAAGDIADCRHLPAAQSGAEKTAKLVERELAKDAAASVLTLGDNTYPVGLPHEFSNCYAPTWGRFKARTLPAAGNHDYYTAGAPGYYGYFGSQAGPAAKGYYTTSAGSWKLIALNSALRGEAFAAQLAWLKTELAASTSICTLAFFHHPPFSSGGHGNIAFMQPVWRALTDGSVDVVLAAHDHHYERFAPMDGEGQVVPRGARQFVVGTGGATFSWLRLPLTSTEARNNDTLGVLKLALRDGGYSWEFLAAMPTTFTDQGEGLCH